MRNLFLLATFPVLVLLLVHSAPLRAEDDEIVPTDESEFAITEEQRKLLTTALEHKFEISYAALQKIEQKGKLTEPEATKLKNFRASLHEQFIYVEETNAGNRMLDAITSKDTKELERLLDQKANPNARIHRPKSSIHHIPILLAAAKLGEPEQLELLIAHGADPKAPLTHPNYNALSAAVDGGKIDNLKLLLKKFPQLDRNSGLSAACLVNNSASMGSAVDAAAILLDDGADPNAPMQNVSPSKEPSKAEKPGRVTILEFAVTSRGQFHDLSRREIPVVTTEMADHKSRLVNTMNRSIESKQAKKK